MKKGEVAKRGRTPKLPQDAQRRAAARRAREKRVRRARKEVQAAQRTLEEQIAQEAQNPAVGRVLGAEWAEQQRKRQEAAEQVRLPRQRSKPRLPAPDAQGAGWTLGQARSLIRQGYHVEQVQRLTGWGAKAFDDMLLDREGYGLPIQ